MDYYWTSKLLPIQGIPKANRSYTDELEPQILLGDIGRRIMQ